MDLAKALEDSVISTLHNAVSTMVQVSVETLRIRSPCTIVSCRLFIRAISCILAQLAQMDPSFIGISITAQRLATVH